MDQAGAHQDLEENCAMLHTFLDWDYGADGDETLRERLSGRRSEYARGALSETLLHGGAKTTRQRRRDRWIAVLTSTRRRQSRPRSARGATRLR